ncbi:MAG: type II secretion system protein [bacterium]
MILPAISSVKQKGLSLIELLVVIGIIILLGAATFPMYANIQVSSQLNESSAQAIQALRTAREQSTARVNNMPHGVCFQNKSFVLYQGYSYVLRDNAYDRKIDLGEALSFSLPGGVAEYDINFSRGLGIPNIGGIIVLTHNVFGSRQVVVNNLGMAEEN